MQKISTCINFNVKGVFIVTSRNLALQFNISAHFSFTIQYIHTPWLNKDQDKNYIPWMILFSEVTISSFDFCNNKIYLLGEFL